MSVTAEAKTYWDNISSAIDAHIASDRWTTARLNTLIGKLPAKIPASAYVCTASATPAELEVYQPLWPNYIWCVRALNFMLNGSSYSSRASMELRCEKCRRYASCPATANLDKIKYCVGTLKVLADAWRA